MAVKILAYRREDIPEGLTFFCDYCSTFHLHGSGAGHRIPHCTKPNPFDDDYYLVDTGKLVDLNHRKTDFVTDSPESK